MILPQSLSQHRKVEDYCEHICSCASIHGKSPWRTNECRLETVFILGSQSPLLFIPLETQMDHSAWKPSQEANYL